VTFDRPKPSHPDPLPSGKREKRDALPTVSLLVVVLTSLIILLHLAVVLWLAWTSGSPGTGDLAYTAQNFVEVFSDARTYTALIDTFAFALISLAVALGFGIPAAWIAERTDFPAKTLLFTLMAVGLLIPGFATAMGWLFLLHPRIGLFNQLLVSTFGLSGAPFNITSVLGMGFVQGLNLAPLAFIMTAAVLRSMDPTLEEAAAVHGAGALRVLSRITVRLAWPGILAAAIYIFMTAFAAFDVPAIIGWGNRIFTFTTYLYLLLNPQDALPRYGLAAALSTVAMAIAALMSWWYGAM
jgi:iron(III) transport system permease protein